MDKQNDKVYRECGPGWRGLIDPLVKRCTELGGEVTQIKEKFGALRFYYYPGDPGTETQWDQFEESVNNAETQSRHICEMCGKHGMLMSRGHWYKTICQEHATELDYRTKVQ